MADLSKRIPPRCWVCGEALEGDQTVDVIGHRSRCPGLREQENDMATGSKKIRWTATGESAPMSDIPDTWDALTRLIEASREAGLRLEVIEVEVEDR